MDTIDGLSDDLIDLDNTGGGSDDDDDGLSGGIIALIVILVVLSVLVPTILVIAYLIYRQKHKGQFDIFQGSVRHRNQGVDYIADNTAVNSAYVVTQELQSSQPVREMASNETEPPTKELMKDRDSDTDEPNGNVKDQNAETDSDKDTRL